MHTRHAHASGREYEAVGPGQERRSIVDELHDFNFDNCLNRYLYNSNSVSTKRVVKFHTTSARRIDFGLLSGYILQLCL